MLIVVLHNGWFDDVLHEFVSDNTCDVEPIYIDSDLYSSTKTIFGLSWWKAKIGANINIHCSVAAVDV